MFTNRGFLDSTGIGDRGVRGSSKGYWLDWGNSFRGDRVELAIRGNRGGGGEFVDCSREVGPVSVSDKQPEGMKAGAAQRSGLDIWGLLVGGFWHRGDPFGDGVRYSEGI